MCRVIAKEVQAAPQEKKKGKEITAVAVKNSKLLSFGDDDEDEDTNIQCMNSHIYFFLNIFFIEIHI